MVKVAVGTGLICLAKLEGGHNQQQQQCTSFGRYDDDDPEQDCELISPVEQ